MSVNRATEVWKEIKPFALRDLGLLDAKSKDSGKSGYFIILYDESAKKLRYYSASSDGLKAALAAATSGDIVWLPACTIANSVNSFTPGSEINTGAIIVTSETGQEISGLTPGQWYAVESWNGYFKLGSSYPQESSKFQLSDGTGFTGYVGQNLIGSSFTISPDFCSFSEIFVGSDSKNYGRTYFLAKTASVWVRVQDDVGYYYDNTGTLSWRLRNATVSAGIVIPSGVEVVGIGENCIVDGSIENNGILTNVKVMGSITGTGSYHAFDSYSTWETNKRIKSDLATGTSPFEIMSTTLNINLNADLLDGYHAEELGDVVGPASAVDGHLVVFDGATGKLIKDGGAPPVHIDQIMFSVEGMLAIADNPLRIYNTTGVSRTISKVFIAVDTAPTGASIIVDIHKDGTTIFTTQANRPAIAAAGFTGFSTSIDVPTWADGSYLTMHIDQIGSTIAGANIVVTVVFL